MQELVTPSQAETLALLVSAAIALALAIGGYFAAGARGVLLSLCGPLLWLLWQAHKWLTGRFGFDSLGVLVGEAVFFILLGVALGRTWSTLSSHATTQRRKELDKG